MGIFAFIEEKTIFTSCVSHFLTSFYGQELGSFLEKLLAIKSSLIESIMSGIFTFRL